MKVLVDTSVWSDVLRSKNSTMLSQQLSELIIEGRVEIIGPIRQEILSGIKSESQFEKLKEYLEVFPDISLSSSDHVLAAQFFNICRGKGIQGSHIDFLICAVAKNHQLAILSLDKDFILYKTVLPILLF